MHQRVQQHDERRPAPTKRRSDDGLGKAVKRILARYAASICMGAVGFLCIALPIAFKLVDASIWQFVVAYGGCLVGIALVGGADL